MSAYVMYVSSSLLHALRKINIIILVETMSSEEPSCSFLAHTSNINDLLEGLDCVLKNWLYGLHDTESSLHIVDLWLHSFDGFHLSGNFDEWLSIIESLQDSGSKSFQLR